MHSGRLYVGSYGYDNAPVLKLDTGMIQRVMNSKTIQEIVSLIAQNPTHLKSSFRSPFN